MFSLQIPDYCLFLVYSELCWVGVWGFGGVCLVGFGFVSLLLLVFEIKA